MAKQQSNRGATIRSVAERAGVSVKTVSRVIGGHPNVSEATRTKVRQVMEAMEYTPSAAARYLRGQGTGLLTVIADNLTTTPDSFELVQGVQSVCDERSRLLMIGETSGRPEVFSSLLDEFRSQRSDAILRITMTHQQVVIEQRVNRVPMVLVNCFEPSDRYPTVLPDDRGGSAAATEALLALGHRRIALVGLLPDGVATQLRLHGYLEKHAEHSVVVDDRLLRDGVTADAEDEFEGLAAVLDDLLGLDDPPSAVMCGNDKMAMRTLMLLNQRGVSVPDDLSIVGYDDYRLVTENTVPRLSTVTLPYFDMGRLGAELALDGASAQRILVPCVYVPRASVAAPTAGRLRRVG